MKTLADNLKIATTFKVLMPNDIMCKTQIENWIIENDDVDNS